MIEREESHTELGTIKVHKNVVASIASIAALEIEGVKKVGGSFKSALLEIIGKKAGSAVKVEFDNNLEVRIVIPLVVKYGFNVPDIANRVQENVRNALEKMTNLVLKDININVQSIEKGE